MQNNRCWETTKPDAVQALSSACPALGAKHAAIVICAHMTDSAGAAFRGKANGCLLAGRRRTHWVGLCRIGRASQRLWDRQSAWPLRGMCEKRHRLLVKTPHGASLIIMRQSLRAQLRAAVGVKADPAIAASCAKPSPAPASPISHKGMGEPPLASAYAGSCAVLARKGKR